MKIRKKIELTAPAGNLEKLKTAYHYGADAAYMGWKKFNLRNMADNFTLSEMRKAVTLKQQLKKKLYLTLNVFPRGKALREMTSFLKKIRNLPLDGIIVSDLGVFQLCKEFAPYHRLHISTQANVLNSETVNAYKKLGAKRVILARELLIDEIAGIAKETRNVELEMFVHGALCLSYSGRCHLSVYMTGRDANFGECTHSCRWKYALSEEKRPGEYFPIEINGENDTFIMNPRDLCLLFYLPHLIRSGVHSFKIEGRMKGIFYIATVVSAYRRAIDTYYEHGAGARFDKEAKKFFCEELLPLKNRKYTADFVGRSFSKKRRERVEKLFEEKPDHTNTFIAVLIKRTRYKNKVLVFLKNKCSRGDVLYFKSPEKHSSHSLPVCDIFDEKGKPADFGRAGKKVWLIFEEREEIDFMDNGIFFRHENTKEAKARKKA